MIFPLKHPTDAQIDWDLWDPEAELTPWSNAAVDSSQYENSVQRAVMHCAILELLIMGSFQ